MTTQLMTAFALAALASAAQAQPCGEWTFDIGPNGDGEHNLLRGVKAFGADNAWAVGDFNRTVQGQLELYGIILHWDGEAWTIIDSPNPGKDYPGGTWVSLWDVDGIAPDDVWAVGHHEHSVDPGAETRTLHWDGDDWSVIPSPKTGEQSSGSGFWAVEAIASDDVWAVGAWSNEDDAARRSPLAAHWDGSGWTIVDLPLATETGDQELRDIDAISSDNIWAVGGFGIVEQAPYVLRWNGDQWSFVEPQPDLDEFENLEEVEAFSDEDVWVSASRAGTMEPVMLHWNGSSWTAFDAAGAGGGAIAAAGPEDVWAVGTRDLSHWDGDSWQSVASWEADQFYAPILGALDASGPCTVFGAGLLWDDGLYSTLTARFEGGAPCAPDLNGDGSLDLFDFLAFVNAFNAQDPIGDWDGDGEFSLFDFLAFVNAFNTGC
jgi:hypothetical protein